ncbi:MAG: hypothetical protein ACREXR_16465, partial [Gammaproteobacteria bacterium]
NFGHSFVSAGLTAAFMPQIGKIGSDVGRVVVTAIVGGTISELTGGKFANGAVTGAVMAAMSGSARRQAALSNGQGKSPGNPKRAEQLMRDATKALTDSGFYKKVASGYFRSERAIAQAWGEIVAPLANAVGAEAGAWISKLSNGAYAVGGVYSDGASDNVSPGRAPELRFGSVAFVHTHPFVDGGQFLSNQYGVGGIDSLGDIVHPGQGDMSWAIENGKSIYSYGGPAPVLIGFNPSTWEQQQIPGGPLQKMCSFTVPAACP